MRMSVYRFSVQRLSFFFLDKGLTKYVQNIYSQKGLEEMLHEWTFK